MNSGTRLVARDPEPLARLVPAGCWYLEKNTVELACDSWNLLTGNRKLCRIGTSSQNGKHVSIANFEVVGKRELPGNCRALS